MLVKLFSIIRNYVLSVSSPRKYNFYHQNTAIDAFRANSRRAIGRNPSMVIPLLANQDLTHILLYYRCLQHMILPQMIAMFHVVMIDIRQQKLNSDLMWGINYLERLSKIIHQPTVCSSRSVTIGGAGVLQSQYLACRQTYRALIVLVNVIY